MFLDLSDVTVQVSVQEQSTSIYYEFDIVTLQILAYLQSTTTCFELVIVTSTYQAYQPFTQEITLLFYLYEYENLGLFEIVVEHFVVLQLQSTKNPSLYVTVVVQVSAQIQLTVGYIAFKYDPQLEVAMEVVQVGTFEQSKQHASQLIQQLIQYEDPLQSTKL
ncbi:UNKNOWN [Stylonychia lemnae]|uniref:Uncharacterized protein n=1 Tax=Stylonychia lemnae TaxID=5949 RepID=A0A078AKL1_STYLE|nr:UNKNOWN [Stylonychia lemnae]|eukprot:CDW82421.1 UNKNOWN [Stylonychia lemnae]